MALSLQAISATDVLRTLCPVLFTAIFSPQSQALLPLKKMLGQYLKLSELLPSTSFPITYTLIFLPFSVTQTE